ncbi:retinal dehydrogenase 1 [Daphnia magna]|uniref:retinal dehydrogenase 1 n=1 Tax=Daphnia magna TaxID=35525 RepID=UPI001E1BD93B|nr:retinal dehydrogenase 1 [Daphnia magna]
MTKQPEIKFTKLFIDGQFVDSVNGKKFDAINPSTGKKLCDVTEGDEADVDKAVEAARRAFKLGSKWRTMDASSRGHLICKLADLIERDAEYLAALETLNNGKPLPEAQLDMVFAVKCLRYYAGWADKIHGQTIPADGSSLVMTRKEPVGVVGQIIPWNYPVLMCAWKFGPALAAGCTIVLKPATETPLTALYLAHLSIEAGFPAGVINVVNGFGDTVGTALTKHPNIQKIAFTGSTAVGRLIMENAAKSNLKRFSLELGGKSPIVVFPDADLDNAVSTCFNAIFSNMGQCCCAGSRTFVHEDVYDEFVKKAAAMAAARKVGNPFDEGVEHGPQVSEKQFNKIIDLVESGKKEGASVKCGGKKWGTEGYFIEPTVFADVTDDMRIAKEEIFGPVQTILKFRTMEELIERANKTYYGLAAGVMTKDMNTALMFAQAVEAGSVWINCYDATTAQTPFGGFKMSGQGRELGEEGLHHYLEVKTITIAIPQKNS